MGKHADHYLQRHQHSIETDTRKRAFARDAVFLGGFGCGSRHLRMEGKFNPYILLGGLRSEQPDAKKILLNQPLIGTKSILVSTSQARATQCGAGKQKTAPLTGTRFPLTAAARHKRA
jgi:hypothetical protein